MDLRSMIGVAALLIGVVACGGQSAPEQAAAPTPSAPARASVESSPAAATDGSPAVDTASLKACEIVTPQEAATIIGGKLLNEPPAGFSNCAYVVEVDGTTESYRISFSAPALHEAMLETQSVAERGESIAGLWGEAYLQSRAPESGYSLVALQRGRIALEVWGDRQEPLIELAKLAVSRVP
jgi:hypothetical protein